MSRKIAVFTAMVLVLQFLGGSLAPAGADDVNITGAGSTFAYPIFSRWAYDYNQITGVKLNYQSIGSGGGIAQIKAMTVDFGASDAPMKPEDLKKFGLIQFPMIMGGVVPVINVPGINADELKLSGDVLAKIFLGDIKSWDDPAIKTLNPDVQLPTTAITVVHRSDGSGTTWIFTNYLSKISPDWDSKVHYSTTVNWPVGLGGKGNEGVAAVVQRVKGAIGYVELAYAMQNKMTSVKLQNKDGAFVAPNIDSFQAAAAHADWAHADSFYVVLTGQSGDQSWPITGSTFVLMHKEQKDGTHAQDVLKFFDWCYKNGGKTARELLYVPVPEAVSQLVESSWTAQLTADGKAIWGK